MSDASQSETTEENASSDLPKVPRSDDRKDAELWTLGALEVAAAVSRGEAGAVEILDAHLGRIAEVNPSINAVTNVLADSAREAAEETDRRRARGEPLCPLAGVPFTVKENIDVAGSATTHGVPAFRDAVASVDAPVVGRLRRAGAIPIGRANMPDLTLRGMHTKRQLFGDTLNPWDPDLTPGGSSGGDAVAVAPGMAALGVGNDSGGSLRIPAAFCGIAGLKPGFERYPSDHRIGGRDPSLSSQLFPVDGPMARSIADLRTVHEILAGAYPRDPRAPPVPPFGSPLPAPIRVAVVANPGGLGVHPDVQTAVETAAAVLEEAGYVVEDVDDVPRLEEALDAYGRMILTEVSLRACGNRGHASACKAGTGCSIIRGVAEASQRRSVSPCPRSDRTSSSPSGSSSAPCYRKGK